MKKEMKCLCLMVVSGFLFVYLFSFVSAPGDNHPCENSNEVMIKLFQKNNSHGALANDPNYEFSICYNEVFPGFNAGASSTDCKGYNALLWLSNETNAHASDTNNSFTENVPVCFEDLSCDLEVGTNSSCVNGGNVVLRMSNESNAHLAEASYTDYLYKLCCSIPVPEGLARWENMEGDLINSAEVLDMVMLVFEDSSLPDGDMVEFKIYEDDLLFDDYIGTFVGNIENGTANAAWRITRNDLLKTEGDYGQFYFEVDGVKSGDLDISPIPDDTPLNLNILNPNCGQWFFKDTSHLIKIVAEDVDDVIDGILRITSVNVDGTISVDVERSFTNGGEEFVYEFPKHGNLGISVSGSSRGFNLAKSSNVMVINENISEFYLAACIDEPENLAHLISNQVEFNASSTIGYVWKPSGCNHPDAQNNKATELSKSNFSFLWNFSEGDSYGPGSGSDYWNFNHTFNVAGNNSATLSVNINSLVVDALGGCGSSP